MLGIAEGFALERGQGRVAVSDAAAVARESHIRTL